MAKSRKSIGLGRKKNSYSSLPYDVDIFKTPPSMLTPIKDGVGTNKNSARKSRYRGDASKENPDQSSAKNGNKKSSLSMSTVKNAIVNIGEKLKGGKPRRVVLQESPHINPAYTTPRRSERIAKKKPLSPINLKMYSPFLIETPDLESSFTTLSKRHALTDRNQDDHDNCTPRKRVRQVLDQHRRLAKSISDTDVVTVEGY